MKNLKINEDRILDKTRLFLKFNYSSVILSLFFGFGCLYFLDITEIIPYVFFAYALLNLTNMALYYKHKHLIAAALATSVLSLICTLFITLFSGGISSPFVFILAIIVLAGYVSTRIFGKIYLYAVFIVIIAIYFLDIKETGLTYNVIPEKSVALFALFSLLFSVYLLSVTFGRNLLKAHHRLYKSKAEIEERILEKETLLREVHHRVKNNLQTVSSLLNMQANNTENKQFKELIKSSQNIVVSMAMIHEKLYTRDNLSKIAYQSYVRDLGDYLIKSYKGAKSNITLHIDMVDINLEIATAIPLGLLINEAITNSLKHGIIDDAEGNIEIVIKKKNGQNHYTLFIGDDGLGFSQKVDLTDKASLGLRLINNLASQLQGSVARDYSKRGTHYIIQFEDIGKLYKDVA